MSSGLNRDHRNRDGLSSVTGALTDSPHNKILVLSRSANKTNNTVLLHIQTLKLHT